MLISSPTSATGKTTISRAIMATLTRHGHTVQPFKCGPDYIDTKFHTAVCHRPSINLDPYMATPQHIRELYQHYSADADISIIEGMMGLFDGYTRDKGSTAQIAAILGEPVILVVNAQSAAYSVAPLISGFIHFRPDVHIAGVIFNKVASPRHYTLLQEACQDLNIPCLGYLPKDPAIEQATRYLGLDFTQKPTDNQLDHLITLVESHIDLQQLIKLSSAFICDNPRHLRSSEYIHSLYISSSRSAEASMLDSALTNSKLYISDAAPQDSSNKFVSPFGLQSLSTFNFQLSTILASPESFSFIYQEHIDILKNLGNITFLDPESNQPIPADTDFLYLPGGYPERHAHELSQATITMNSIRDYVEQGGKTLAECGGMIYLSQGIHLDDDHYVPMAGILPFSVTFLKPHRRLSLGYRQFQLDGKTIRGHEFHYSQIHPDASPSTIHHSSFTIHPAFNAKGEPVPTKIYRYKNLIASYIHLYFQPSDFLTHFNT